MRETSRKKAILAVSFGTSYEETRKKTIDRIEDDIREAYPDYDLYRAWTSGRIREKIRKRDGIQIPGVRDAMEEMLRKGVREVIVQPTHVMNGEENEQMSAEAEKFRGCFDRFFIGTPLLTTEEDNLRVMEAVVKELPAEPGEALVLMGHGTGHYANSIYAALDYQFKDMGYPYVFMGTVEAYPDLEALKRQLKRAGFQKLLLAPFMIVAGDHALHDLAGENEDSWKSVFEREGFEVRCVLRGLGEFKEIRNLFLEHIKACIQPETDR